MGTFSIRAGGRVLPRGDALAAVFGAQRGVERQKPTARPADEASRAESDEAYCRASAGLALAGPGTAAAGIPLRGIAPHL